MQFSVRNHLPPLGVWSFSDGVIGFDAKTVPWYLKGGAYGVILAARSDAYPLARMPFLDPF